MRTWSCCRIMHSLFVVLLIAGCANSVDESAMIETTRVRTVIPAPTNTAIPATAVSTNTPVPTSTATPLPTNTPTPPTNTPEPSLTATNTAVPPELLDPSQLIVAEELSAITEEFGIVEWQMEEETLWEYRICHTFTGYSWSANPNHAINCVFALAKDATFESTIAAMYEWEILGSSAIELESTLVYENDFALYTDMYEQAYYDAFLMGDGVLYWISLSIGVPVGYTPETLFAEFGTEIETMIDAMLQINLEKRPN